jgi:hypothetical protein
LADVNERLSMIKAMTVKMAQGKIAVVAPITASYGT